MSTLSITAYKGAGEVARKTHHYSQTIRVPAGDVIHVSGQVGNIRDTGVISSSFKEQVDLAFENVDFVLKENEGSKGWLDVYRIRMYVKSPIDLALGFDREKAIMETMRKYMPNHHPVMTLLGVSELAAPHMLLEIEVEAHVANKSN